MAKHPQEDRNFDDLAKRFQSKIYDSMKGRLRLAVLRRDMELHLPQQPLNILDVGAGQGQWALEMLRKGNRVQLTDISAEMLALAKNNIGQSDLPEDQKVAVRYLQTPLQELSSSLSEKFDLVACHAVLEWLDEPEKIFTWISPLLKENGWCSLIFYNLNGLIFKNLLRANYKKVIKRDFRGSVGGLTPLNPLVPQDVIEWAKNAGYEVVCQSGIRVFHDYVLDKNNYQKDPDTVEKLELLYSQQEPYRDLGRYMHLLLRRIA
ncbi:methyltransferase domain-containing protein [Saccharophagus sp. K07]|jgi:S-adenosylmethionine-dependent methyltransferase|uniref:methyltransferase domain-containing protein n=1 Tax=Saccharophagus sp. K07 TaxID=2283636 RepID=UPI0016522287|nr:methyltransferase domain-containing protein [Saccharophagus sp. K07]MBC6906746.1 methyltransferase domain-containing protein [Saccharophagus sp. K07]